MKILWRLIKTCIITLLLPFTVIGLGIGFTALMLFSHVILILITFILLFIMVYTIIKESEDEK